MGLREAQVEHEPVAVAVGVGARFLVSRGGLGMTIGPRLGITLGHYLKIVIGESRGAFPLWQGAWGMCPREQEPPGWVGGWEQGIRLFEIVT